MRALGEDVELASVGRYRGLDEVHAALAALGSVREVGRTHEDRPLWRLDLGPADAPKVTLVIAGLHAMEWIGVETALALADMWAADPPTDRRLVLLPVLNPDGYARVEANLRAGRWRYVRANARGVDLNRNFPTFFQRFHLVPAIVPLLGRSGAGPASEAETQATLRVLESERGKIDRAVSLHSFGRKILLPHGGTWKRPANYDVLASEAQNVRARLSNRYDVVQCSRWWPGAFARGIELDHFHAEGILPLLVECSGGGFSLWRPSTWLHPFRWYNPREVGEHASTIAPALFSFAAPHPQ